MNRTALIVVLVISVFLMSCSKKSVKQLEFEVQNEFQIETMNIGGSVVKLAVAATNIGRMQAANNMPIERIENVVHGILYVYDGNSPVTFRQKICAFASDIAFLDSDGKIIGIYELPPTPHNPEQIKSAKAYADYIKSMIQQQGREVTPEMEEYYLQQSKLDMLNSGFISWANPKNSAVETKFVLHLPGGFFSEHKIAANQSIELTDELKKLTGEKTKPVIEFEFEIIASTQTRDKKYFTVDVADTLEKRSQALSTKRLNNIGEDEMIALMWKNKRQINFNVVDTELTKLLYIVLADIPENAYEEISGNFVGMEPPNASPKEIGTMTQLGLKNDPAYRNYSYRSVKKYNCMLIFSKKGVENMRLKENRISFKAPPELVNITPVDDPAQYDVVYKIDETEITIKTKVKLIQDEVGRLRGLKLAKPLPKYEISAKTDTETAEGDNAVSGYLLRFDRIRKRPIYTAELSAPFDIALLNANNAIVKVIEIPNEQVLSTMKIYGELMEFSEKAYQAAWIMPFKWFSKNELAKTDDEGNVQYLKGKLLISTAISRETPEPTRYKILIDNIPVWVELFMNSSERDRGLQFVQALKPDCGALFLYKNNKNTLKLWMPNCLMDLSALYIDKSWHGKHAVQMLRPYNKNLGDSDEDKQNRPENEENSLRNFSAKYGSKYKVEYAIEMERGWFMKNNLAVYADDRYNSLEEPSKFYTDIKLVAVPKITIIKGSPVVKFLENVK
ncbi:MAG: DUF192 domain-containing protein [Planctomycetes bacterium]|nr:DUF192 domain-containing protein [Planctomycetota bacterium]